MNDFIWFDEDFDLIFAHSFHCCLCGAQILLIAMVDNPYTLISIRFRSRIPFYHLYPMSLIFELSWTPVCMESSGFFFNTFFFRFFSEHRASGKSRKIDKFPWKKTHKNKLHSLHQQRIIFFFVLRLSIPMARIKFDENSRENGQKRNDKYIHSKWNLRLFDIFHIWIRWLYHLRKKEGAIQRFFFTRRVNRTICQAGGERGEKCEK